MKKEVIKDETRTKILSSWARISNRVLRLQQDFNSVPGAMAVLIFAMYFLIIATRNTSFYGEYSSEVYFAKDSIHCLLRIHASKYMPCHHTFLEMPKPKIGLHVQGLVGFSALYSMRLDLNVALCQAIPRADGVFQACRPFCR